ncbi:MAG: hypothetical protein IPK32_06480 [Verrucomicrobiaceae bacterium]|nr:hypothetical protein [Verrucomicrobiaceae bacterium]
MKPICLVLPLLIAAIAPAADPIAIGSRRSSLSMDCSSQNSPAAPSSACTSRSRRRSPSRTICRGRSGSGYHSLFKDGDKYRMYYKSWQLTVTAPGKVNTGEHPLFTCYAESADGIHWRKPELGLHDFRGSKANNIVIPHGKMGKVDPDGGHPAVFKDENPQAAPDAKYKAILRSNSPKGLSHSNRPTACAGPRWPMCP